MPEQISYRGFVKITENYSTDSEYAVFKCNMENLHPIIYRNLHDYGTWCLSCDELNTHDFNLCPACTVDSWKKAVDLAIIEIHNRVMKIYDSTALMMLNGAPGQDTGFKGSKFNVYRHGEIGNATCCEAKLHK